jgi:hypothetical protein
MSLVPFSGIRFTNVIFSESGECEEEKARRPSMQKGNVPFVPKSEQTGQPACQCR